MHQRDTESEISKDVGHFCPVYCAIELNGVTKDLWPTQCLFVGQWEDEDVETGMLNRTFFHIKHFCIQ